MYCALFRKSDLLEEGEIVPSHRATESPQKEKVQETAGWRMSKKVIAGSLELTRGLNDYSEDERAAQQALEVKGRIS